MAEPLGVIAAVYPRRNANSGLPGNLFGRDLQNLRCLRPSPRCRGWLPGPHGAWRRVESATAARDVTVGEPWR